MISVAYSAGLSAPSPVGDSPARGNVACDKRVAVLQGKGDRYAVDEVLNNLKREVNYD